MRMRNLFTIAVLCAGATMLTAQVVPQQKTPPIFRGEKKGKDDDSKARSLSGVVKDEQDNNAEGAVVQLKDTKSLQVRSFITKEDGSYQFHGLSSDVDYQVKADKRGTASSVKTLSVFDSRRNPVINLKLEAKK